MSADILRILVVLLGIVVVAIVLIQQPKEGGMSAFTGGGGGASGTVFGAKGSGSFFFKLTAGAALLFAVLIIALVKVTNSDLGGSILSAPATVVEENLIPGQANGATKEAAIEETLPGVVKPSGDDNAVSASEIPGAVQKIQQTKTAEETSQTEQ